MQFLHTEMLLDISHTITAQLFSRAVYPWEVLPFIGEFIKELGKELPKDEYDSPSENVWIHKSAKVAPSASITGPCIICEDAEIRHCAFIRGNVVIGRKSVLGNSCEMKNAILCDEVQVPHFNYVGDSVLGYKSHMGAGSITSNVRQDKQNIVLHVNGEHIATGLRKFGAILGDHVEVGCNAVMNPGSVIGRDSNVYPLSMVRGFVPACSIYKNENEIVAKR